MTSKKGAKQISFKTEAIFGKGFKPSVKNSVCVLGEMLEKNVLTLNGQLEREGATKLKKRDIWSYIYYLWHNNKEKSVFVDVQNTRYIIQKASPQAFADAVKKSSTQTDAPYTKENLIRFVNKIVADNTDISIPILHHVYKRLLNSEETNNIVPQVQIKPTVQVKPNGNKVDARGINVKYGVNFVPVP